jgi:hypothetical protein
VFLVNSRLGLFSATPSRYLCKSFHANGVPLLPKLRGHFAEFLNEGSLARLRILTLPTCVGLRYGHQTVSLEVFLDSMGTTTSVLIFPPHHFSGFVSDGFAYLTPYKLGRAFPTARLAFPPVSPHPDNDSWWHRILNLLSIAYAFRPRLRSRLTLGGRAFPRKP